MFLYWGRRGLSRFAFDAAHAALANPRLDFRLSVSRQNEIFSTFSTFQGRLLPVSTFSTNAGALANAWRIPLVQRSLTAYLRKHDIEVVVDLMPHVWSSLMIPAIKATGARSAVIAHDADTHPGDYRSLSVGRLVRRSISQADVVLTLSQSVASKLKAQHHVPANRIRELFHPDLDYGARTIPSVPQAGGPMRIAFFGRIMPYKGLPLFVETIERLREEGLNVEAGVFGEGPLGSSAARLEALGAEIINRWLSDDEIRTVLPSYHAIMLPYIEASQSGVAATALGTGLPLIATPVGGLVEQVRPGVNGTLAHSVEARELAKAAKSLLLDPVNYTNICKQIAGMRNERTMDRFVDACIDSVISC